MSYYLLAEPAEQILKEVYSGQYQQPQINYLFDQTDMASLKEISPVLVYDKNITEATLKNTLEQHSGLLIQSSHPKQHLLAHLRQILFVYFKPEQIALFRYYDPYIASYFFTSLNQQDTANWLGPIAKLQWYNTNWHDKVTKPDQWQQWNNPNAPNWQLDQQKIQAKPVFETRHNFALQEMQQEKFAYEWQQDLNRNTTKTNIDQAISWVKEASQIGCCNTQDLNQFLAIRSQHSPNAPLPEEWPNNELTQKLDYLASYLEQKTAHNQLYRI